MSEEPGREMGGASSRADNTGHSCLFCNKQEPAAAGEQEDRISTSRGENREEEKKKESTINEAAETTKKEEEKDWKSIANQRSGTRSGMIKMPMYKRGFTVLVWHNFN